MRVVLKWLTRLTQIQAQVQSNRNATKPDIYRTFTYRRFYEAWNAHCRSQSPRRSIKCSPVDANSYRTSLSSAVISNSRGSNERNNLRWFLAGKIRQAVQPEALSNCIHPITRNKTDVSCFHRKLTSVFRSDGWWRRTISAGICSTSISPRVRPNEGRATHVQYIRVRIIASRGEDHRRSCSRADRVRLLNGGIVEFCKYAVKLKSVVKLKLKLKLKLVKLRFSTVDMITGDYNL